MDRYGRVLFNKNRELSQASLDVDKEGSISVKFDDQQDQEEEKKAADVQSSKKELRLRSVSNSRRLINSDQPQRFSKIKKRPQHKKKRDPMDLEFEFSKCSQQIANRLDKMKKVLQSGRVIN